MANVVDWTVDKLLGQFQQINAQAATEQTRLRYNRDRYMNVLRSLSVFPEGPPKAAIKAELSGWIRSQVAAENRFNEYAAKWVQVKAAVKRFLQSVNITPPQYLGAIPLAPAAVVGLLLAAAGIVAWIRAANTAQGKTLDGIAQVISLAREQNWTPEQARDAIREVKDAASSTTPGDPFGISETLKAALPVLLVVAAIYLIPQLTSRRAAA